jgi:hypothetical protein
MRFGMPNGPCGALAALAGVVSVAVLVGDDGGWRTARGARLFEGALERLLVTEAADWAY